MEAPYKHIYLTYRNEVKPLVARIESERSEIPDDVVYDTATTFEKIAISENPDLSDEEKSKALNDAMIAMKHCFSVCYQQLISARYKRVKIFREKVGRAFLLSIEKGKAVNDINAGLQEFEKHYQQCDISEQVSREREVEDLPHYKAAHEALIVPYEIACKYESHLMINKTALHRPLTSWQGMAIAILQCVLWGLVMEIIIEVVKIFI